MCAETRTMLVLENGVKTMVYPIHPDSLPGKKIAISDCHTHKGDIHSTPLLKKNVECAPNARELGRPKHTSWKKIGASDGYTIYLSYTYWCWKNGWNMVELLHKLINEAVEKRI